MRRKLLFLLFLPSLVLWPLTLYLRVQMPPATHPRLEGKDQPVVLELPPSSPLAEAGLRQGDRLISLDGQRLTHAEAYWAILLRSDAPEVHKLAYEREGRDREMEFRAPGYSILAAMFWLVSAVYLAAGVIL